jgi:hypothetical protein
MCGVQGEKEPLYYIIMDNIILECTRPFEYTDARDVCSTTFVLMQY